MIFRKKKLLFTLFERDTFTFKKKFINALLKHLVKRLKYRTHFKGS